MSDASQGPGWWQASDSKWYPPEQFTPPAAQSSSGKGCLIALAAAGALAVLGLIGIVVAALAADEAVEQFVSASIIPPPCRRKRTINGTVLAEQDP